MRAGWFVAWGIAAAVLAGRVEAAPQVELQNLKWFVVDGIGQGQSLAHWQGVIDQGMADAKLLLQGDQGPADVPCCTDLRRTSITSITAPTLLSVDLESDYDDMLTRCTQSGGGSCAFLVDSITWCGGPAPGSIGCGDTPECSVTAPNDDPTLVMVVSLDALADGSFAATIAHERGHNACLEHVPWAQNPTNNPCALMQAAAGGGCLTAVECGHYRDAGNADGGSCPCHSDAFAIANDGAVCSDEAASGICSGGVCGAAGSDASVALLAAGGTASIDGDASDTRLSLAGLTGGWVPFGATTGGIEITGMEYAPSRAATFAVTAADELLRLDPVTGITMETIGTLPGTGDFCDPSGCYPAGATSAAFYDSLAFDPGLTPSLDDDRLYAVRVSETCRSIDPVTCGGGSGFCAGQLVAIDPDDAETTLVGDLDSYFCGGSPGLAFDSVRRTLYVAAAAGVGLFEIDCESQPCVVSEVLYGPNETDPAHLAAQQILARFRPALAYDASVDRLYRVGSDASRQLYDVFDAETLLYAEPIGIDGFTAGALAAPEPAPLALAGAAVAALWALRRRR